MGMNVPAKPNAGSEAREIGLRIFRSVLDERRTIDDLLEHDDAVEKLEARDRAFLSNLLRTAFRYLGEIEAVKARHITKSLPRKSGAAGDIITLAIAQLLFLETPAHAAIDMAVRLARADRNATHFSGLVNAVLRKVAAEGRGALTGLDGGAINTPGWLWKRWLKTYGTRGAEAIAAAHKLEPALDIEKCGVVQTGESATSRLLALNHRRNGH